MFEDQGYQGPAMAQQVPETFTQSDSLELQNLNNGEGQARRALYDGDIDHNAYGHLMQQIHSRRAPLQARQQQAQQQQQQAQIQQAHHTNAMQQAMAHSDAVFRAKGFHNRVSVYTDPLTGNRAHVAEMAPGKFEQLDMGQGADDQAGMGEGKISNIPSTDTSASDSLDNFPPTTGLVVSQEPQEARIATPVLNEPKPQPYDLSGPGAILANPGAMQQAEKVYVDPRQIGPNRLPGGGSTQINMPQAAPKPTATGFLNESEINEFRKSAELTHSGEPESPEKRKRVAATTQHYAELHARTKAATAGKTTAQTLAEAKHAQDVKDKETGKMDTSFTRVLAQKQTNVKAELEKYNKRKDEAEKAQLKADEETDVSKKQALQAHANRLNNEAAYIHFPYIATPELMEAEAHERAVGHMISSHGWTDEHFNRIGVPHQPQENLNSTTPQAAQPKVRGTVPPNVQRQQQDLQTYFNHLSGHPGFGEKEKSKIRSSIPLPPAARGAAGANSPLGIVE